MTETGAEVSRQFPLDAYDVLILLGAGAVVYGVALIWGPWAWLVGGVMALAMGMAGAARKAHGLRGEA